MRAKKKSQAILHLLLSQGTGASALPAAVIRIGKAEERAWWMPSPVSKHPSSQRGRATRSPPRCSCSSQSFEPKGWASLCFLVGEKELGKAKEEKISSLLQGCSQLQVLPRLQEAGFAPNPRQSSWRLVPKAGAPQGPQPNQEVSKEDGRRKPTKQEIALLITPSSPMLSILSTIGFPEGMLSFTPRIPSQV